MNFSGFLKRLLLGSSLVGSLWLSACGDNSTSENVTPPPVAGQISLYAGSLQGAGSADGVGIAAQFAGPEGVALDRDGNLYITDTANHTIRKLAPDGTVTTIAGAAGVTGSADGPGNEARFSSPRGIALDSSGNVYVADFGNHTIRRISQTGQVTTWAGAAGEPGNVDGPALSARFLQPTRLTVDANDTVYVTDQNQTVRSDMNRASTPDDGRHCGCAGRRG